jgi:hypothetical protein
METTQGISLYSYPYLEVAKHHVSLTVFYAFFFYKIGEQEGRTGSAPRCVGVIGEVDQIMYTHVSKFNNDTKIKKIN